MRGVRPTTQRVLEHAATVACCVTFGVLAFGQEACLSALGHRECAGPPECVGEAKLRECNSGEGYSHWSEHDCPSETRCISTPHGARCAAASEGDACQTDRGCFSAYRCEDRVCRGPAADEKARCQSALRVTLPEDGSEIVIDVPLTTPSSMANVIARPACSGSSPLDRVVAEGFVHIPASDPFWVTLEDDRGRFPSGVQFAEVDCLALYKYGYAFGCNMEDPAGTRRKLPVAGFGQPDATILFYTTSVTANEPVLRVRFKKLS